jgi:hypothetical protein
MATSLRVRPSPGTYQRRDRVAEALARRLQILPESARQILVGPLAWRAAECINAFRETNEFDRGERWVVPIRAALEHVAEEPLSRTLIVRAQEADAIEDMRESAYLADPSPANRDAWLRALDHQHTCNLALRMALTRDRREELR